MKLIRSCPVCDLSNYRFLYNPKQSPGKVVECTECGMIYVTAIEDDHSLICNGPVTYFVSDPKILISSNLSDVKDFWEIPKAAEKELNLSGIRKDAKYALNKIEYHLDGKPLGLRILDFGSGWGFFLATAREQGWKTQGLEPLAACSVYSRAKFALDIVTDTLHANTFAAESFDCITSFQVFEHLTEPQATMKNLQRILKKGGVLLLEVPNIDTWTVKILKSYHRHFTQDHINFFSKKTLSRLLRKNGFEVVEQYYTTRNMTIEFFYNIWLSKFLPQNIYKALKNLMPPFNPNHTVPINVGDIIATIARKL